MRAVRHESSSSLRTSGSCASVMVSELDRRCNGRAYVGLWSLIQSTSVTVRLSLEGDLVLELLSRRSWPIATAEPMRGVLHGRQ